MYPAGWVDVEGRRPASEGVGFYDQMLRINADFLDREELGMESVRRVSDALQRISGIKRVDQSSLTGNTTRQFLQVRSGARVSARGSYCLPAVYVGLRPDGVHGTGDAVRGHRGVDPWIAPIHRGRTT